MMMVLPEVVRFALDRIPFSKVVTVEAGTRSFDLFCVPVVRGADVGQFFGRPVTRNEKLPESWMIFKGKALDGTTDIVLKMYAFEPGGVFDIKPKEEDHAKSNRTDGMEANPGGRVGRSDETSTGDEGYLRRGCVPADNE